MLDCRLVMVNTVCMYFYTYVIDHFQILTAGLDLARAITNIQISVLPVFSGCSLSVSQVIQTSIFLLITNYELLHYFKTGDQ